MRSSAFINWKESIREKRKTIINVRSIILHLKKVRRMRFHFFFININFIYYLIVKRSQVEILLEIPKIIESALYICIWVCDPTCPSLSNPSCRCLFKLCPCNTARFLFPSSSSFSQILIPLHTHMVPSNVFVELKSNRESNNIISLSK